MIGVGQVLFAFFEDSPQDAEGASARFGAKLSGHNEALPCLCRRQSPAADHAITACGPVGTARA